MKKVSPRKVNVKIGIILILVIMSVATYSQAWFAKNSDAEDWQKWFNSTAVRSYLDKCQGIIAKTGPVAARLQAALTQAQQASDNVSAGKSLASAVSELSALIEELEALKPPKELEAFDKKLLAYYINVKLQFGTRDAAAMAQYRRKTSLCKIEFLEELKRVYARHGAPKEVIENTDAAIAAEKKFMQ